MWTLHATKSRDFIFCLDDSPQNTRSVLLLLFDAYQSGFFFYFIIVSSTKTATPRTVAPPIPRAVWDSAPTSRRSWLAGATPASACTSTTPPRPARAALSSSSPGPPWKCRELWRRTDTWTACQRELSHLSQLSFERRNVKG